MRVEIYGCYWNGQQMLLSVRLYMYVGTLLYCVVCTVIIGSCFCTDGIVSYSMPQGDKRGSGWEFFDATYDGHWDGELQRGLGQLTDGKVGPENFKMGYYSLADYERGLSKLSKHFYTN